jgi:plastocyanin
MLCPTHSRYVSCILLCMFLSSLVAACEKTQHVSLTAEDFRFVPILVRVTASLTITLSLYNEGRETHDFDSPLLIYAAKTATASPKSDSPGILLPPGQSIQIVMAPPPGTYLYICRRKGHANMTGTLIVE